MSTIYENEIIENKMTEILNTRLDTRALMTVDSSLSESAGLRKVINRYTYNGAVEFLAKGAKNRTKGTVSFVPEYYDVKRYQQTFEYNDMDAMADPYIVEVAMQGAVTEISNEINKEYIDEILKISNTFVYDDQTGLSYNDIVDALATVDCEVDGELFMIMGAEARRDIRKNPDFVASKQGEIMYSGQFGTICGIPVIFSKLMPASRVVVTSKDAVRFFVKKEASVEQARDIETKNNTIVYERHGLIALVDDTHSVSIAKLPKTLDWTVTKEDGAAIFVFNGEQPDTTKYKYSILADLGKPSILEGDKVSVAGWYTIDINEGGAFTGNPDFKTATILETSLETGRVTGIWYGEFND